MRQGEVVDTVEYAPGRLADVHRGIRAGHVLLWHGRQPDMRDAVAPLAGFIAARGPTVYAADWNSHADDGGRSDLLRSLRFVRDSIRADGGDPDSLVLVGWSMGGTAAAGLALHARKLNIGVAHTVCLAGGFSAPDPISGNQLLTGRLPKSKQPSGFTLLHGVADDVVPVATSRAFAQQLTQADWPVEVVELPTGHGGIAGAELDPTGDGYQPATDQATRSVAIEVAERIAALTSSAS
jgi:dienelactone hydrolase